MSRQEQYREHKNRSRRKMFRGLTVAATLSMLALAGVLGMRSITTRNSSAASLPAITASAAVATPISRSGTPMPSAAAASSSFSPQPSSTPASSAAPASVEPVKLAIVGDVLLGSTVENVLKQDGFDAPYRQVKSLLQRADITLANLETPVTERGTEQKKEYVYRSSPKALPAFADAGFDVVNLANNHSMDYGPQGLLDTFDELDKAGIKRIGAGRDADEAYNPVIMESKGMKIAFLGFSGVVPETSWKAGKKHPGVAETYDYRLPVKAIEQARTKADLVVVMAHWGEERKDKPNKTQTDLAKRYIDAGADLVVGSHPHVLQGFEQYKGKWIAYSLGNFIFTTNENKATWDTIILEAACGKDRRCELNAVPVRTVMAKPEPMSDENARKLFDGLGKISLHAKVDAKGLVKPAP